MSDDFDDDFDLDGFDDGGFDSSDGQKGTLGDLWRNNPLVKIGVIAGAVLLLVGGVVMFGGESKKTAPSLVSGVRNVNEAPGVAEVSENIREATEEEDTRRREVALRNQTSAMPTLIDPPKGTINLQIEDSEEEDPLERWRRMQQERIKKQQVTTPTPVAAAPEPEVDTRTPAVNALAGAISQQMGSVLGAQKLNGPLVKNVTSVGYLEAQEAKKRAELEAQLAAVAAENPVLEEEDLNILLPAGTIEYAQMLTEANTDAPGPILAQIVSGPLKGGRMIGTFTSQENYLTLNFNTIVLDGIDFAASGIAIDPNTTLPGVVTDIDRRYFSRVILPAAAEFVTGLTEAIADSGTTTVTVSGDSTTSTTSNDDRSDDQEVALGIEAAGEEIGEILDEIVDEIEPLLRVRAGTPIGVLFVSPVIGTPQVIQLREEQERENERLLRFPTASSITSGATNILPQ